MTKEKNYDQKTKDILKEFSKGKTKEEVAKLFNYKSLRGLESYMARRGLKYHKKSGNYISQEKIEELEERKKQLENSNLPLKVKRIIQKLEKADPRTVAKEEGLGDEIGLGRYMKKHKLYWSSKENTYIYSEEDLEQGQESHIEEDYREILAYLAENMERLRHILSSGDEPQGKTIAVSLEKDLAQALKHQATQEGVSKEEALKKALREYLGI